MMNNVTAAVVAVPSTMLVMATMAGATAAITHDKNASRKSVYATGIALGATSIIAGSPALFVATVLAVAASMAILHPIWFDSAAFNV
jgi:hypothetical protein